MKKKKLILILLILVTFWNQPNNALGQYRQPACAKIQFICQQIPATMPTNQFICQQIPNSPAEVPWDNNIYPCSDGGIVAVEYPNGQVKYYFVPKNYCQPQVCCNQISNGVFSNTPWEDKAIKSDLNAQQQIALKQLEIRMLETHLQGQQVRNLPPYQLMFHQDAATSTTDLRCFCPTLDNSQWFNQAAQQPNLCFQNPPNNPQVEQMQFDAQPTTAENKDKNAYKVIFNDIVSLFSELSGKVNQEEQPLKPCRSTTSNELKQKIPFDHNKSPREVNKETKNKNKSSKAELSVQCSCSDCCCRY